MILEHALLQIRPGHAKAFEETMRSAIPLIAATPGFMGIEVRPCLEMADLYLLLVRWNTLQNHTIDFRQSDRYLEWKRLLHDFYEPFPVVAHYGEPVASA